MAGILFALCALTSLTCAWLLLRAYRQSRHRLLFWSGLCFVGLTFNNVLLLVDRVFFVHNDLTTLRLSVAVGAMSLLVFGLVWEED
jgi:hypothetical protein